MNIPQAREATDKFKMLIRQMVGVNLTNGYNGNLTSREAGDLGVGWSKICPIRKTKFERKNRIASGHVQKVEYIATITA